LYICVIWFLISSLSLGDRSAHKLGEDSSWSLTFREERRLRILEKWVLRRIFEPKRDEVTWEWRKIHVEELYDL
jgi:hypothetical protein